MGTLAGIASGKTGDFLCCMSSGVEFIARSDISQDTAVARITVSAYVDKGMPSQEISFAATEVNTSEYNKTITQLDPGNNKKLKKQFMKVSSTPISSASETMQEGGSGAVDIQGHNSDQDYLNGSGSLLITNTKLEPCKGGFGEINVFGKHKQDNWSEVCNDEDNPLGSTDLSTRHYIADIQACFTSDISRWKGEINEINAPVKFALCPANAREGGLLVLDSVSDPDITEQSYCSVITKIQSNIDKNARKQVFYPKATLTHEKKHVEQIRDEVDAAILTKGGLYEKLNSEQYTLAKPEASNATEAQKKLKPYFDYLWNNTKDDLHDNLANMSSSKKYDWQYEAEDVARPVYEDLIKQILSRAEIEGWKPCTE